MTMTDILSDNDYFLIDLKIARKYDAPSQEFALYKNIPIAYRDHPELLAYIRKHGRVRYRGPRLDVGAQTCLRSNAVSFSIYPKDRSNVHYI